MRIAYHSRSRASAEEESALGAEHHATLESLLAASDVVSLHCPGGAATRHLINANTLARMKSTAILINTARGSVVDEEALANALAQRQIAAAGLDVYEREPAVSPALRELENAVLLPHLGSATLEARTAYGHANGRQSGQLLRRPNTTEPCRLNRNPPPTSSRTPSNERYLARPRHPLVVGVCGSQGSGKSTGSARR